MPLYYIRDDDRPAYVVAANIQEAIIDWRHAVARENCGQGPPPEGAYIVADDTDLILNGSWAQLRPHKRVAEPAPEPEPAPAPKVEPFFARLVSRLKRRWEFLRKR